MKHFFYRNLFLSAALVASATVSVRAQQAQTPPPTPPTPPATSHNHLSAVASVGEPVFFSYQGSSPALQKKIKLDMKDKTSAEIFRKIAEQTEAELVVDAGALSDRKYTIKAENFTVQNFLNGMCNFEGVRWRYQDNNGKKQIRISRGAPTVTGIYGVGTPDVRPLLTDVDDIVKKRLEIAQGALDASRTSLYFLSAKLPDTRVNIDRRDADVRDVLKDILTQANLPYALEDDVPTGQKRSFTFENVPISMALDIITTSIGIGWNAEAQRTATRTGSGNTPALPLVRVGKKYTGRGVIFRTPPSATRINLSTTTTSTTTSSDTTDPTPPAAPATP